MPYQPSKMEMALQAHSLHRRPLKDFAGLFAEASKLFEQEMREAGVPEEKITRSSTELGRFLQWFLMLMEEPHKDSRHLDEIRVALHGVKLEACMCSSTRHLIDILRDTVGAEVIEQ